MEPRFFPTPRELREWLEENHATARELWIGFYKKGSGRPSITWPEAVDEALRFGWIDGVRKGIDDESYTIRFTPRKPGSIWSAVNVRRAQELIAVGSMRPAGLAAFEARSPEKTAIYSYEQRHAAAVEPDQERQFRADEKAWDWFQAQPPSYRRAAIWWIVSAKREETRRSRLATLIEHSAQGRRVPPLTPPGRSKEA